MEVKSHSFTNGSNPKNFGNKRKTTIQNNLNLDDYDDELEVRFVNDIDSLVPPKYNPDTRTYFKCSIYSPSNRLYTVNEEVNSTYSDAGCDQFSSSLINSGGAFRMSTGRSKITQKINNITSCMLPDKKLGDIKILEEENDDDDGDACNISEGLITPHTPSPRINQHVKHQIIIKDNKNEK